jgi:arylsulfatase A-like enzyme
VISDDLFSTFCAMAGATIPKTHSPTVDGRDLSPLLRAQGDAVPWADRSLLFHYPHKWGANGPGIAPFSAIRRGKYKLIHYYADRRNLLFDLEADLSETTNLAESKPAILGRMLVELRRSLTDANAQLPVIKATGQAAPLP